MSLTYNTKIVEAEMTEYLNSNPGISGEAVEKKRAELICRETIYAIWIDYHTRFGTDKLTPEQYEADLRSGKYSAGLSATLSFFNGKAGPDRERLLESFQKFTAASQTGELIKDFEAGGFRNLNNSSVDATYTATVQGDEYIKGMFAPVTDGSGMVLDEVYEAEPVTIQALREAQADGDAIKITPPQGMTEDLVTYAVMGEFFKAENMNKLEKALMSRGSSLPEGYSIAEHTISTFFENTIKSETRANMQGCRLIIPEVRKSAQKIIEGGDRDAINANLKKAFDELFTKAASSIEVGSTRFAFSVRHATRLVEAMRENKIEPASIGISEDRLATLAHMKKTLDFVTDTARLQNSLSGKSDEYFFSGFSKENDIVDNGEVQAQLQELAARKDIINEIESSIQGYHQMYDMAVGALDSDEMMGSRGPTEAERRLMTDEEGMLKAAKKYVSEGEINAGYEKDMATPGGRYGLLANGITTEYRHQARASLSDFIDKGQKDLLDHLESYARGKPRSRELLTAIQKVRTAAASVRPDSTWQEKDTLIEPYKTLAKEAEKFSGTIQPEAMSERENLKFLSLNSNLPAVIRLLENNPDYLKAQAEHEIKRAQLHDKVKNYNLKFDEERVNERLADYKLKNPNATRAQLNRATVDITADEARIYSRLAAYERCMPGAGNLRNFSKVEQDVRQGGGSFHHEYAALNFFEGEEKLKFVSAYQKNFAGANDQAGYENISKCLFYLGSSRPGEHTEKIDAMADNVYKGLFAPKTDRSLIRMTGIVPSGGVTEQLVGQWQDETDAIEIPVPEDVDASLVDFMVMGRTMQNDLLTKASGYLFGQGAGSTMPKDYDPKSNVKVSLFDNLVNGDTRGNMNCLRSVVPQARREVKDLITNGDDRQLKGYIKTAFDTMYRQMTNLYDHSSHTWLGIVRHMGRLLDGLENSGITPQSIGIDPAKVEMFNGQKTIFNMIRETARVQDKLCEGSFRYFESGFNPKYDPTGNNSVRRLLERKHVLNHADKYLSLEVSNYKSNTSWMQLDRADDFIEQRGMYSCEIMCSEDPQAFEELMGRQVKQTVEDHINGAGSREMDKLKLVSDMLKSDLKPFFDQVDREKNITGLQLEEGRLALSSPIFNGVTGIKEARLQLDELIEFRNGLGELTPEKMQTLAEPYARMSETFETMLKSIPQLLKKSEVQAVNLLSTALDRSAVRIPNEPERIERAENYAREFAEIKQGLRPAFMDRYRSYRGAFEKLSTESKYKTEFNTIISSMDKLNSRLDTLCADRKTILARSDARELKKLYTDALNSTVNFINLNGRSPVSDDRAFMATELRDLLARETGLFDKLPNSNFITVSDAISARYGAAPSVDDTVDRFRTLAVKLEEVGSRFGGNSPEFDNMKKTLDDFRKDKNAAIDRKKLNELSKALAESAEKYISAKKTVPFTEKGKRRLQLAREARELCAQLREAYNYESFGGNMKDRRSFTEKLDSYMKNRENAAYDGIRASVQNQNSEMFKEKLTELLYVKDVQKKLRTDGEEAAELLQPEKQQQQLEKLGVKCAALVENVSTKEMGMLLNSPDAGKRMEQLLSTGKKSSADADRSDSLVASKRPKLGF